MGWFVSPKRALNAVSTIGVKRSERVVTYYSSINAWVNGRVRRPGLADKTKHREIQKRGGSSHHDRRPPTTRILTHEKMMRIALLQSVRSRETMVVLSDNVTAATTTDDRTSTTTYCYNLCQPLLSKPSFDLRP